MRRLRLFFRLAFVTLTLTFGAQQAFAQKGGAILPGANARAPISINAEKLDYFEKEQKLIYTGAVVATQGDSTLKSTALTIFLSGSATQQAEGAEGQGGNQVRRMEAVGPVTITSKDQVGQGDRGVYDKAENKVYLYNNVSLSQGTNVIKGAPGSHLVYDLTSGRANVVGGVVSSFVPGTGTGAPAAGKKPPAKPAPKP